MEDEMLLCTCLLRPHACDWEKSGHSLVNFRSHKSNGLTNLNFQQVLSPPRPTMRRREKTRRRMDTKQAVAITKWVCNRLCMYELENVCMYVCKTWVWCVCVCACVGVGNNQVSECIWACQCKCVYGMIHECCSVCLRQCAVLYCIHNKQCSSVVA
jgi:hypothetical protein